MKIAVIGNGRTGQEVVRLLRQAAPKVHVSGVFNEDNQARQKRNGNFISLTAGLGSCLNLQNY